MKIKEIALTRVFLSIGIPIALISICLFIFHIPGFWSQILAIIASAFLGAGVTAWITNTLLKNQQESEENKEKNIKVFENKIQVYSEFISKMWKTLEDDVIEEEEIRGIRSDIFKQLVFYINEKSLPLLVEKIKDIKRTDNCQNSKEKDKITGDNIKCFSEITELLRADAHDIKEGSEKDKKRVNDSDNHSDIKQNIHDLWKNFGLQPRDIEMSPEKEALIEDTFMPDNQMVSEIKHENIPTCLNNGFWHFTMLGAEEQLHALLFREDGNYELNLIEYGEEWRTNLIKQVGKDDLVFLFQSGGLGYMGVYRAIGWRIFEFGENEECKETIHVFGEPEKIITDKNQLKRDIEKYDIYCSKGDGASLCSSIIVEPLAFTCNGIGNPGGVYRRTISRYYQEYAMKQLARFMAIMEDDNVYNVYNGVKMGCNKELFKKILEGYNIKPSPRNEW